MVRGGLAIARGGWTALLVAAALAAVGIASTASATTRTPQAGGEVVEPALTQAQLRARLRTTAWIPSWDLDRARTSLRERQRLIGRISPVWYELRSDGRMVTRRDGALDADVLAIARERRISVVPTVTNDFDRARVTTMLATPQSRLRHVNQLVAIATRSGVAGIDIDYEDVDPADGARFTLFVELLARRLHASDRQLTVDVPPATSSAAAVVGLAAYDLRAIGAAADEVRVLAYDYSTPCSGSGPIAPIDWVRRVVEYTLTEVPARKLVLGIPLYGYDWPRTGCAESRTWQDTDELRRTRQGTIAWSNPFQTRQLRYTAARQRHLVWFEDARSTAAKLRLAHEKRLRGVALWRLGGEDPGTWRVLAQVLGQPRS